MKDSLNRAGFLALFIVDFKSLKGHGPDLKVEGPGFGKLRHIKITLVF